MSDDFSEWCKENGIELPVYDAIWTGGEYAVRHVDSGVIVMRCGFSFQTAHDNAAELNRALATHRQIAGNEW